MMKSARVQGSGSLSKTDVKQQGDSQQFFYKKKLKKIQQTTKKTELKQQYVDSTKRNQSCNNST
jgi:hypothetical protein